MTTKEAMAIVLAAYPRAGLRRETEAGRTRYHVDDGDPAGYDLTTRPSDTAKRAWEQAAGRVVKAAKGGAG